MIIATFDENYNTPSIYGKLWQYNYGQILRIQGLDLPSAVEIHFSLEDKGVDSITRIGVTKDSVTNVIIPDSILENGDIANNYYIYAFIYLRNDESGETTKKIRMTVKARPKPEGYNSEDSTMSAILKIVNSIADEKADGLKYEDNILSLIAGEKSIASVTITGGSITPEQISEAVKEHLLSNPIEETDPTVPAWAKEEAPDKSLTQEGKAADAKEVGDRLGQLYDEIANKGGSGITLAQVTLFEQLFNNLAYTDNVIGKATADSLIASLRQSASSGGNTGDNTGGDSGEDGGEDTPNTFNVTISAPNTTYDNQSLSGTIGESYTVTFTPNDTFVLDTVTVTMNGVDITSSSYSDGTVTISEVTGDIVIMVTAIEAGEPTVKTYTITNSLTNATTDNNVSSIEENASYTATITPNEQYKLGNATVTMGGVDVTSTVYLNGVINIPQVTGNVIIMVETISTKAVAVYTLPRATTFNGDSSIDTNITLDLKNTSWNIVGDVTNATSGTMFATHGSIEAQQLCVRNHGNGWGVYHIDGNDSVKFNTGNDFKFVITHNEGESTIDVYNIQNGELTKQSPNLFYLDFASNFPTTLKLGSNRTGTDSFFTGTVNDFKIYNGMLIDSEINEYLGV